MVNSQKKNHPLVSVIMSVYNGEPYIEEAINSILSQTLTDWEFLIVNDGSTDATETILKDYASNDSRIKILTNTKNIGLTKSLNLAIRQAKAQLIARQDADDICLSTRLAKQKEFLEDNPEVGLVGTGLYIMDEQGKIIDRCLPAVEDREIRYALIRHNIFCHSSIMIRKEVFIKVGLYDEHWITSQDYEFYFRAANYYKLANLEEPLVYYRRTKNGITFRKDRIQKNYSIKAKISAIRNKQYPRYCYIYVLYSIILIFSPKRVKDMLSRLAQKCSKVAITRKSSSR
jgi:glycosyltransferase involved in cell wall biosynthesis